ncbi:MAG TPA: hypothetical protein VK590_06610, partial [Saprospiraceae bacterium]|nr:hypothetical protein [Saprospiraceae bacterium]
YFKNETSNIKIVSVRAGNVIGGGDWAEKRLIPDCLKAWSAGKIVEIRNPNAIRPWQHVLEPLSGYLLIGQMLYKDSTLNGEAFNFGPASDESNTVKEMIDILCEKWGHSNAKFLIIKSESFPEAGLLRLSCEKALAKLLWKPVLDFRLTLQLTVDWYKTYYEKKEDMYQYTFSQLLEYIDIASQKKLTWTIAKSA